MTQPSKLDSTPVLAPSIAAGDSCQRRILMNTIDARLIAINADNGEFCEDFGNHGVVNLKEGLGEAQDPKY